MSGSRLEPYILVLKRQGQSRDFKTRASESACKRFPKKIRAALIAEIPECQVFKNPGSVRDFAIDCRSTPLTQADAQFLQDLQRVGDVIEDVLANNQVGMEISGKLRE
jgi:hypothetical protein